MLTMYRKMLLIRRFEERAGQQYGLEKIAGFCHLYIGQEAVAVGANEALRPDDYVITAYRDHGQPLARGADAGMVMAELFGRTGGYSKGKGGSMHFFDIEHHFYGGYGIVGGQIPLAAGHGLRLDVPRRGSGDRLLLRRRRLEPGRDPRDLQHGGEVEAAGDLHLREQPLRHGHGHRARRRGAGDLQARRRLQHARRGGRRHGRADRVRDGEGLVEYCRAGNGPVLLEAHTYRFRGHSMSDPATYRTKEEVEEERKKDPIPKLRDFAAQEEARRGGGPRRDRGGGQGAGGGGDEVRRGVPAPDEELWSDTIVEEGEQDVRPRERVLGAKVEVALVPLGQELKVTWDLEPRDRPRTAAKKAGLVR